LKAARLQQGLSLTEVGERSGIGKANLSRLENDASPNPTWDTIIRYAESVGRKLEVNLR
jgi:transcriptional regulator with XRE-family HTH domain